MVTHTGTAATLRRSAKRATREAAATTLGLAARAVPALRADADLAWFVILTMPNSGSTAMAQMLATAPRTIGLTPKFEGEWLIPSLSSRPRAWSPRHRIDESKLRATWVWHARRRRVGEPVTVIEKSPSNMVRRSWLEGALAPMPVSFLVLVRDPYAVCSGWFERYGPSNTSLPRRPDDDDDLLEMLGRLYLDRLRHLGDAVDAGAPVVRYEDFVTDPTEVVERAAGLCPCFAAADPSHRVEVKDYPRGRLENMNERRIAAMGHTRIRSLTRGLQSGAGALGRYGYALRS